MGELKVVLVAFIEHKEQSFKFSKWPNHITIVPYFKTRDIKKLINQVENICTNVPKIKYQIGKIDYFGAEKNLKVSRVKTSSALTALHNSLLQMAKYHDKVMDTKFCYPNYNPHITHNHEPYPCENEEGVIGEIYLIKDLSTQIKEKEVIAVFKLG